MASVISVKLRPTENKGPKSDEINNLAFEQERSTDAARNFTESIVERRGGPGILILTSSTQLLYKDRRAWDLCAEINNGAGSAAQGVLPRAVVELCDQVNKLLQIWTDAKDWEQNRIKRVIGMPDRPILLSGLGLPDRHGVQQSRILITMEGFGRRQAAIIEQVKDVFRLTDREVTVVQNLLKGWTNKEIAAELGVTEQTVKEHIKHIMAKTKTTTRTGILVQVLRL
jgi:DNA-binding CsgD family transcriptional regulator